MSRRILAAVAAVVIVAAAMGVRYLVVSADASAGAARAGADHLLKGIDSDTMQVDRTLAAPLFPNMRARDPNFGIRKQAFDAHVERIGQARSLVAVDQGKLRSAGDTLRVRRANLLALTERSTLDRELGRVAAMRSALDEADAALLVERDQSRTLSAVCDALADTDTMFMRFGDADYVGAVAMFSGVDLKLQTAADLARSNSVPAPVDLLVRDVRAFVDDLEAA